MEKECWYHAVVGGEPKEEDCERLHPNGCDDCSFYLQRLPESEDKTAQDELPYFEVLKDKKSMNDQERKCENCKWFDVDWWSCSKGLDRTSIKCCDKYEYWSIEDYWPWPDDDEV